MVPASIRESLQLVDLLLHMPQGPSRRSAAMHGPGAVFSARSGRRRRRRLAFPVCLFVELGARLTTVIIPLLDCHTSRLRLHFSALSRHGQYQ